MKEQTEYKIIGNNSQSDVNAKSNGIEELRLQYKDERDRQELEFILTKMLSYPSSKLAQIHRDSYKLGIYDIQNEQLMKQRLNYYSQHQSHIKTAHVFCPDCGFSLQKQSIPLMTPVSSINNFGLGNSLYFFTLLNLSILLTLFFLFYGIYSLTTNIMAAQAYKSSIQTIQEAENTFRGILALSLGSKQIDSENQNLNNKYYVVQCWIGVGTVIAWAIFLAYVKIREIKKENKVIKNLKSIANFSVTIENIPVTITGEQLQTQFRKYWKDLTIGTPHQNTQLELVKLNYCRPFYLSKNNPKIAQINRLKKQYKKYKKIFIKWIKERRYSQQFSVSVGLRQKTYEQMQLIQQKMSQMKKSISEQIEKQYEQQEYNTTVAFVTLRKTKCQQILLQEEDNRMISIFQNIFFCCGRRKRIRLVDKNGKQYSSFLKRAPQPEDVLWDNLGQTKKRIVLIKLISFVVSMGILGVSFVVVLFLARWQTQMQEENNQNLFISFLISLSIPVFNLIIQQVLKKLTFFQKDYTFTIRQASIGIKGILASLINTILFPIVVAYSIKGNLYGVGGLSYDIFFLGVTNSLIPALVRIFDIYFWLTRLFAWIMNRPLIKLYLNQRQLNMFEEYIQFEPGYGSVPVINSFLFTCFFASLQPIIILFAILGNLLMYFTQKYVIFHRSRRPIPGSNTINRSMYSFIRLGPFFYSLGSLTWSIFFKQKMPASLNAIIVSLVISVLIFIMPYRWLIRLCIKDDSHIDQIYEDERIFFSTEYDRLNPKTCEKANAEYYNFLKQYKKKLDTKQPQQLRQFQKQYENKMKMGTPITNPLLTFVNNMDGTAQILPLQRNDHQLVGLKLLQKRKKLTVVSKKLKQNQNMKESKQQKREKKRSQHCDSIDSAKQLKEEQMQHRQ